MKETKKELDVKVLLRLPKSLKQKIEEQAKKESRSVNGQIVHLLKGI